MGSRNYPSRFDVRVGPALINNLSNLTEAGLWDRLVETPTVGNFIGRPEGLACFGVLDILRASRNKLVDRCSIEVAQVPGMPGRFGRVRADCGRSLSKPGSVDLHCVKLDRGLPVPELGQRRLATFWQSASGAGQRVRPVAKVVPS